MARRRLLDTVARATRRLVGYTRPVAWKRLIGLFVLFVLTGLPVSAAVCAVQCEAAVHHHGPAKSCHEPAPGAESTGARVAPVPSHDCGDHDAVACELTSVELAAIAAPASAGAGSVAIEAPALSDAGAHAPDCTPPDTAPSSARSLVLRI